MSRLPALVVPDPSPTLDVVTISQRVVEWAERSTDLPAVRDAWAKLDAIDQYLATMNTQGRQTVSAAMRRLEVRIGELLGPAQRGASPGSKGNESSVDDSLSPNQRRDFRDMAKHPDAVEAAIAEGTDDHPTSRRKVLSRIRPDPPDPLPALNRQHQFITNLLSVRQQTEALAISVPVVTLDDDWDRAVRLNVEALIAAAQLIAEQLDHLPDNVRRITS